MSNPGDRLSCLADRAAVALFVAARHGKHDICSRLIQTGQNALAAIKDAIKWSDFPISYLDWYQISQGILYYTVVCVLIIGNCRLEYTTCLSYQQLYISQVLMWTGWLQQHVELHCMQLQQLDISTSLIYFCRKVIVTLLVAYHNSVLDRGAEYCDKQLACLSVCLSVGLFLCEHILGTTHPNFTNFLCILLVATAQSSSCSSSILCTSGYMDDVFMFSHNRHDVTGDTIGYKHKWLTRWKHRFDTVTCTQTE